MIPTAEQINKAFEKGVLTPRQNRVLQMRFGMSDKNFSLEEIGCDLGVARERVRQIIAKALDKLNISTKQNEVNENKSNFFHGNCRSEEHITFIRNKDEEIIAEIKDKFCLDHDVSFCKCGWQWGFHFGYNSSLLKQTK